MGTVIIVSNPEQHKALLSSGHMASAGHRPAMASMQSKAGEQLLLGNSVLLVRKTLQAKLAYITGLWPNTSGCSLLPYHQHKQEASGLT